MQALGLIGLLVWASGGGAKADGNCADDQYACLDHKGTCIPLEWSCDNVKDCDNGRDEATCKYVTQCPDNYMVCKNYACVDARLKCGGFDDCLDGSDERACPNAKTFGKRCSETEFQCKNGPCIKADALCDGYRDCPEADDEEHCEQQVRVKGAGCAETHFECASDGNCVPLTWVCDGMLDCADQSDELFCTDQGQLLPGRHQYHQAKVAIGSSNCTNEEFSCNAAANGERRCVGVDKLCDGRTDCPQGDDEGGFCGHCASFGCQHSCVDSPIQTTCKCREGFVVAADGRSCDDVDECADAAAHSCRHYCLNTVGAYTCACASGYHLDKDERSCVPNDAAVGQLFVSFGHEVRTMGTEERQGSQVSYGRLMENTEMMGALVHGLDFDDDQQRLYMALSSVGGRNGAVHYFAQGEQQCMVDYLTGVSNVAVDWITGNIYYTAGSPSLRPGVGACRRDGRFCRRLYSDQHMHRFRGLAVHPRRGLMFWTNWGKSGPHIEQAALDGGSRVVLTADKLLWPNGLTVDYVSETLYFADAQLKSIEKIDILTHKRSVVTTHGVHHPYDLVIFNGRLFWSDWNIEAVVATELRNVSERRIVHSLPQVPYGLAVNHPAYHAVNSDQPNPCANTRCSHMCLLSEEVDALGWPTATCVCPDHYQKVRVGLCAPMNATERRKRQLDKAPEICTQLMSKYCEQGVACLNGGACSMATSMGGKMSAITCDCPLGFIGHYCEVQVGGQEESMSFETLLALVTVFLLVSIVAYCLFRKSGITPEKVKKTTMHNIGVYGPMVRFASGRQTDTQPILGDAVTAVKTVPVVQASAPTAANTYQSTNNTKEEESFSNPLYEDMGVYAPTTQYEEVFDPPVHTHPAPVQSDVDSGWGGSGNFAAAAI